MEQDEVGRALSERDREGGRGAAGGDAIELRAIGIAGSPLEDREAGVCDGVGVVLRRDVVGARCRRRIAEPDGIVGEGVAARARARIVVKGPAAGSGNVFYLDR